MRIACVRIGIVVRVVCIPFVRLGWVGLGGVGYQPPPEDQGSRAFAHPTICLFRRVRCVVHACCEYAASWNI